jgi:hypothetical protein
MTQTTETGPSWTRGGRSGQPGSPGGPPGGPQERLPVPTRQRRPALAALALVLVLGGAALSAFLVLNSGQKQSVLALSKDVPFGHVFVVSDFHEDQISFAVSGPRPVKFNELSQIVGRHYRATVPLRNGTILTTAMISTQIQVPGNDYAEIGATVGEGMYPAGLRAGDKVKVLYTPSSDKAVPAGGVKNGVPLPQGQTLVDVAYITSVQSSSGSQGSIVVSMVIKNDDLTNTTAEGLPMVAQANAVKSVTLVLLPESTQYQTGSEQ